MRYFVKTEHGELAFDSMTHLREMYEKGLVEPGDQVRAEDSQVWRKAEAVPELRGRLTEHKAERGWMVWGVVVAVLLAVALRLLVSGHYIAAAALIAFPC